MFHNLRRICKAVAHIAVDDNRTTTIKVFKLPKRQLLTALDDFPEVKDRLRISTMLDVKQLLLKNFNALKKKPVYHMKTSAAVHLNQIKKIVRDL